MEDRMPRVSIGLPVYNGAKYLEASIQSILSQTYKDFELIICDNCSTDTTPQICERFAQQDARVRYHRNAENLGANGNFNHTVELARGEYFKWAAHDDLILPTYLEQTVARLDANPAATLCYTHTQLINDHGKELIPPEDTDHVIDRDGGITYVGVDGTDRKLTSPHISERFRGVLFMTHWTHEIFGLMRIKALRRTPLLEPTYGTDKVLMAELAVMGPFEEVPEKLFLNRRHAKQSVSQVSTVGKAIWSDTRLKKKGQAFYSRWLRMRGYARAALRARSNPPEMLRCLGILFTYYARIPRWRMMLDDVLGLRQRRLQREIDTLKATDDVMVTQMRASSYEELR